MEILKNENQIRVVKNEVDYEAALEHLGRLMSEQPEAESDAAEQLETLAVLVRAYELSRYSVPTADPIEAIQFRMDQQGLAPRDLIPFLGSRSRVSEVLARKRPLTLQMIRNLHQGLGIPASSLLQPASEEAAPVSSVDWKKVPFQEMKKRGWINRIPTSAEAATTLLNEWVRPLQPSFGLQALYRLRRHVRSARPVDDGALFVWTARVAMKAIEREPEGRFDPATLSDDFLREVCRISVFESGPKLAQEFLGKHGITLVVEQPLPKTYVDGAAMLCRSDLPVIALTLRYDRLDSFWFTLIHELVHLAKHLGPGVPSFYDDLDSEAMSDPREIEADALAGEILIPTADWEVSPASKVRSTEAAVHLARKLKIHPAIVAGRIRFVSKDYRVLTGLVGQGEVRKCFQEYQE
jgi:HTH-type transcriptional regulator/antitoxin HigA